MDTNATNIDDEIKAQFEKLPKVVRNAITSADLEKRLRALADTHKLHVDQWETLETEVMLTLLGMQRIEEIEKNIASQVGVSAEVAHELADHINTIIFEPVRQELERQLEHPEAKAETTGTIEAVRTQILGSESAVAQPTTSTTLAPPPTPPVAKPEAAIPRGPSSGDYKPGEASTERKSIVDDPYREPPQ